MVTVCTKVLYGNIVGSYLMTSTGLLRLWVARKGLSELDYFFENNLFNMGNQPDIHVPFYIITLERHGKRKS